MKRTVTAVSGMIILLMLAFGGMIFNATKIDANAKSSELDNYDATYTGGLYGTAADGGELALFWYKKGDKYIAFVADGKNYSFTDYEEREITMDGVSNAKIITLSNYITLTYYEKDSVPYIVGDNGYTYTCEFFTANAAENIIDLY